jgi:cob(I)alamin adenosyltransferase
VGAVTGGLLAEERLYELLDARPAQTDLVLTGHRAELLPKLLERADLVTEMRKVKHPYDSGVLARKTIDY